MKRFRNSLFYISIFGVSAVLLYWIVSHGSKLERGRNFVIPLFENNHWTEFVNTLAINLEFPFTLLIAQIIIIIIVARLFGWICKKIGQPSVIGEIIAGIALGPSLIGMYFPDFSNTLFPVSSLENLRFLSQIGLMMFMFVVGLELDLKVLRTRDNEVAVISNASIVIPFTMGFGLAYLIYQIFAPAKVSFFSFGLFMGVAMSITAFPVLARIVKERGLSKTKLGALVITCAAANDITSWLILAIVIALVKSGSFYVSIYTIILAIGYILLMIMIVKPFLKRIGDLHTSRENLSKPIVSIFILNLMISSYVAEIIGIHVLFGAFMAGAIMPENIKFRNIFIEKVEDLAMVLLLPIFFIYTGLRTEIGLLNNIFLWEIAGLIILVAVAGKFLGSALAAKFVGHNLKESLIIGALLNTRGLMELVVLNIGYDLGVLKPDLFAIMVIMTIVTTIMAGPALSLINRVFKSNIEKIPHEIKEISKYKILFSFGNPESGRTLLRLANAFTRKGNGNVALTAMHLSPANQLHHYNEEEYETESFLPVIEESQSLNQKITTLFKSSNDIDNDIAEVANQGDYDLLLIGIGQSIYAGSLLGKILGFTNRIINREAIFKTTKGKEKQFDNSLFDDRTRSILTKTQVPVGILVDKKLERIERVFIPVFYADDTFLISHTQKLIHNIGAQIVILDAAGQIKNNSRMKEKIRAIEQNAPNHISLENEKLIDKSFLEQFDLMLISIDSWKKVVELKSLWLQNIPSTLIISDKTEIQ